MDFQKNEKKEKSVGPIKHKDPLHGVTLQMILADLERWCGWQKLGKSIKIRCFTNDPSIGSSLKFLRKTPWARKKVEDFYMAASRRFNRKKLPK
jgi:uncharacterized protein (DUF2132 family)